MSDTPRTDAVWEKFETDLRGELEPDVEFSTLARQLERELNAANSKIELLMSANADVARIAGERDAAEKRIRLLIAERDTARLQTDQKHSLREEFRELLGTDDIKVGVAVVRDLKQLAEVRLGYIKQLTTDIERLTQKVAELYAGAEEQKQGIKRLEEAGDVLFENSYPSMWDLPAAADQKLTDQSNWLKAKEAKP